MDNSNSNSQDYKREQQDPPSEVVPYNESGNSDPAKEVVPYNESEVMSRDGAMADVNEKCACPPQRYWIISGIRKDDEFFHFVIICFAIGILLVCYYKYNDWTVSIGIGLMTFAALETTGIYFGLLYRIRNFLESLIPLFQRIRTLGFKKEN